MSEGSEKDDVGKKTETIDIVNAGNLGTVNNDGKNLASSVNSDSWWNSWIGSAKLKSATVFEAVRRDLDEISTAVRSEVSYAGSVIGGTLKLDEPESTANTVKKSLSSFFEQVGEVLVPTIDDSDDNDDEAMLITADSIITLSGFRKHLAELQANDKTYLTEPDIKLMENYQRWLEIVDQEQFTQNQLAKRLTGSEILNEKYLNLVPDQVSHMEFWKRYLFRRALLEDALANAELAERRAKAEFHTTSSVLPKHSEEIIQTEQPRAVQSDGENDATADIASTADELNIEESDLKWVAEISEEEQARLLEEYEAEIQERERRKTQSVQQEDDKFSHPVRTSINKIKNRKSTSSTKTNSISEENIKHKCTPKHKLNENITSGDFSTNKQTEDSKVDTGAASDESWEKDFDLSDH